jgi:hypothetical protein
VANNTRTIGEASTNCVLSVENTNGRAVPPPRAAMGLAESQ